MTTSKLKRKSKKKVKSELRKINDAKRHKEKYALLTVTKKKELSRSIADRNKQKRRSKKQELAEIEAVKTLMELKNEPNSGNRMRCKRYRENKKLTTALLSMRNSRALRLKFDMPNYNEDVHAFEVDTQNMGKGVQAGTDMTPASLICPYEGELLKSYKNVQKRLREGHNKILNIGKNLWIDGQHCNSLGSKFNHACNCIANCEFVVTNGKAYVFTKASALGVVKKVTH
jgi:hypothetical protein